MKPHFILPLAILLAAQLVASAGATTITGTESTKAASPAGTIVGHDVDVMADGSVILCWNNYAAIGSQTPYFARSTDHGTTWAPTSVSPDGAPAASATDCAVDSVGNTILYANQQYVKVRVSTNGGATFTNPSSYSTATCSSGASANVDLAVFSSTTWILGWAGATKVCAWTTTDGGSTYTNVQISGSGCTSEYFGLAYGLTSGSLLAACDDSLWRSTNGGATWSSISEPAAFSGADLEDYAIWSNPGVSDTFWLMASRAGTGIQGGSNDEWLVSYDNTAAAGAGGPIVTPASGAGAPGRARIAQGDNPALHPFYQMNGGTSCMCWNLLSDSTAVPVPTDIPINVDARFAVSNDEAPSLYAVYVEANAVKFYNGAIHPLAAVNYRFNTEAYFCSERGAERFAYNYKEGVTFNDNPSGLSLVDIGDALMFQGDEDDFDYLGKTIPASYGAKVFFQIEASTDNLDSVFRVALSFVDTAPFDLGAPNHFLNGPDDPGPDAKGDGLDEGVFEEYIEVRFLEVDDDWNIAIFHVSQDNDVEDRTKIGQSFVGDNPGDVYSYELILDTVAARPYISVRHGDGSQIGTSIVDPLNVSLPAFFAGKPVYSQWYVGYGTAGVVNFHGSDNAVTFLDNKDQTFASTCIYLLMQFDEDGAPVTDAECIGNCGTRGPVLVPSPNGTVPEGTQANGGLVSNPLRGNPSGASGGLFGGLGVSQDSQFLFGFAIMIAFLLVARRKFQMEPHTITVVVGVLWVFFVAAGIWPIWTLIAAGVIGIVILSKRIAGSLGG